jgi:hypothetical protein
LNLAACIGRHQADEEIVDDHRGGIAERQMRIERRRLACGAAIEDARRPACTRRSGLLFPRRAASERERDKTKRRHYPSTEHRTLP